MTGTPSNSEVERLKREYDEATQELAVELADERTEVERLREALAELIDVASGMDGQLEQEFGLSTDPGYGQEDPAIVKARAALRPTD